MERRAIVVRGTVQGVGFRPFVYGLATRLALSGFVQNASGSVRIEVEGDVEPLDQFLSELACGGPVLARVDEVSWTRRAVVRDRTFVIEASTHDAGGAVVIAPDTATCDDCLAELFDPGDRRYRYPFNNCTNCGPRLSIVTGAPYDRARTTMAAFAMCAACRGEYDNPADRRFHAQPVACPACGPRLQAVDGSGQGVQQSDPLAWFIAALRGGKIGALKGLGGYQLVCDATHASAVRELRRRKHRDEKPFALMVADLSAAMALCEIGAAERELLVSSRRPIVLLKRRSMIPVADGVAPGHLHLGVMLPCTPLHHLLLRDIGVPLVMTSGNRSEEPIAYEDADALERLGGIADVFLIHDRPIHVRCDDSVTRVIGGAESLIRRSRGYAPQPIRLPAACPQPILAVSGQMKSTFALGLERQAVLSQHMGDLDHFDASQAFERDVALYERLYSVKPACIVHDLHPDYASTRYAQRRATSEKLPLIAVQHHHAHMASCMAEHDLTEPVIGVIWDGTGYGIDGAIWGGEFMVGGYRAFKRVAHLRYVGLPGGEKAVREPWRMAAAYLQDANIECVSLRQRIEPEFMRTIRQMIDRRVNTPLSSSAGRLFDAVASIVGIRDYVSYEGQAAIQLESIASSLVQVGSYPFEITEPGSAGAAWIVDARLMIRAIAEDVARGASAAKISGRFHSTLVDMISAVCRTIRERYALSNVVLSGGVFMNALLAHEVDERLSSERFHVYRQHLVPPNDGGISLGQLAIAASQLTAA